MANPLPAEVQLMILRYVDQAEIRNWRLVCRSSNYAATPLLFRSILMFPSMRSVENAKSIAGSKHIAPYVLSLEYVAVYLPNHYYKLATFRQWIEPSPPAGRIRGLPTVDVMRQHKQYLKEAASQAAYNHCHEVEALVLLGSSFRNLQEMTVRQHLTSFSRSKHSIGSIGDLTTRLGYSYFPFDKFSRGDWSHFHDLFMACAARHLQKITCDHLVWTSLFSMNSVFEEYPECGQSVRCLELHACSYDFQNIQDLQSMKQVYAGQLGSFVQKFCNLEELKLGFGVRRGLPQHSELQIITDALLENFWPRLRSLKLTTIAAAEDRIVAFLARHDKTLRSLHLGDVSLFASSSESVFSLLSKIREALHLEEAQLSGSFTRIGFEAWLAKPVNQPEWDVLSEIQLFLCRKAPYPISSHDIYRLINASAHGDYTSIANFGYTKPECSFQWCYEQARQHEVDDDYPYDDGYDDYDYDRHRHEEETSISTHYGFVYDERGFFGDSDEYSLYSDYSDSFDSWATPYESEEEDKDDSDRSDRNSDEDDY